VLRRDIEFHPIFGVIRRRALADTQVLGTYVGADVVTLAELALKGRFVEVPERLFLRRYHDGTSVRANPHPVDRARWWDPAKRWRAPMRSTRLTVELTRAIARSNVGPREKARCSLVVARHWVAPRWRDIGGEWKRTMRAVPAMVAPR
jgi:hypothetical protein